MNYENITIEAVVKYDKISEDETYIVGNCEQGGYGLTYNPKIKDNEEKKNGMIACIDGVYYVAYGSSPQKNIKYSISGRYDGKEISLFENEHKTTKEIEGKIVKPNDSTIMILGGNPDGNIANWNYLSGTICSVRIYNRALTDEEVMQNYKIDKMLYGVEDIEE